MIMELQREKLVKTCAVRPAQYWHQKSLNYMASQNLGDVDPWKDVYEGYRSS